jgi:hypothetical protein
MCSFDRAVAARLSCDCRDGRVLHFGPTAPKDDQAAARWIRTIPGSGWFAYFGIYGPDEPAFDGRWHLPDFERVCAPPSVRPPSTAQPLPADPLVDHQSAGDLVVDQ